MTHPLNELISTLRAQWDALHTHELTLGGIRRHAELTGLVWRLAEHLGVPAPTNIGGTGEKHAS